MVSYGVCVVLLKSKEECCVGVGRIGQTTRNTHIYGPLDHSQGDPSATSRSTLSLPLATAINKHSKQTCLEIYPLIAKYVCVENCFKVIWSEGMMELLAHAGQTRIPTFANPRSETVRPRPAFVPEIIGL